MHRGDHFPRLCASLEAGKSTLAPFRAQIQNHLVDGNGIYRDGLYNLAGSQAVGNYRILRQNDFATDLPRVGEDVARSSMQVWLLHRPANSNALT